MVRPGDRAPALEARGVCGRGEEMDVSLASLAGRWAVVFFYPRDFTVVCPTEILELSKRARELRDLSAEAIAISVDDVETHRRWIAERLGEVAFPLAADPDRVISQAWGALLEAQGVAGRATFLVDPRGVVRHACYHDLDVGRSISELLRVLEALQTGEKAPAEWRPGTPTLGR
ncbi:MAG TPA: peroxiredoxin [Anaeromyxobacter sp.]|nr:peroxiredoxin [Anaeromyxobacter sp.]